MAMSDFTLTTGKSKLISEIEIDTDDENFIFTDDGIFYQGHRVILYIRDQVQYFNDERRGEYKFHVAGCSTLRQIYKQGDYGKYVVAENTTEIFKVNYIYDNDFTEATIRLRVCKHCLKLLNWQGYKKSSATAKNKIYENFSLEEFFRVMNNDNKRNFDILPDYTDETAPLNIYPPNWAIISKMLRTESGFVCSDCHRKISDIKNLHVHHVNGIKSDCSRSNLEVLCAPCHQKRHSHKILIW